MDSVRRFHKAFDQHVQDNTNPDVSVNTDLRVELIREEFEELKTALDGKDKNSLPLSEEERIIAVADALGDLVYVIAGAALTWGIDLESVVQEIHDSNMTKVGGEKRADGKVLKPSSYRPPNILDALRRARDNAGSHLAYDAPFGNVDV